MSEIAEATEFLFNITGEPNVICERLSVAIINFTSNRFCILHSKNVFKIIIFGILGENQINIFKHMMWDNFACFQLTGPKEWKGARF